MAKGLLNNNIPSTSHSERFQAGYDRFGGGGSNTATPLFGRKGDTYMDDNEVDLDQDITNATTRIQGVGATVPQPDTKKENLFFKALDIIDRPRNAVVNAIQDFASHENGFWQGFGEGLTGKERVQSSELLDMAGVKNKYAKGIGGFMLDAFVLDPLSWMTLGLGSFAKGAITGTKTLGREGAEILAKQMGKVDDVESVVQGLMKGTGKGVTVGTPFSSKGMEVISGTKMQNAGAKLHESIAKVGSKIPVVGDVGSSTKKALKTLFNPFYIDTMSDDMARVAFQTYKNARNTAAIDTTKMMNEAIDFVKKSGATEDDLMKVYKVLEMPAKEGMEVLANDSTGAIKKVADYMKEQYAKIAGNEVDAKLLAKSDKIDNYMHHTPSWELKGDIKKANSVRNAMKALNGNAMRRKLGDNIDEANAKILEMTGISNFFEKHALKAFASRVIESNQVLGDKKFMDTILESFGTRLDNAEGGYKQMRKSLENAMNGKTLVTPTVNGVGLEVVKKGGKIITIDRAQKALDKTEETLIRAENALTELEWRAANEGSDAVLLNAINSAKKLRKSAQKAHGKAESLFERATAEGAVNTSSPRYLMDTELVNYVNQMANKQVDKGVATVGRIIDRFNQIWKPTVTGLNPAYHMRNAVGSSLQNFLDVGFKTLDPKIQKAAYQIALGKLDGTVLINGKKIPLKQIADDMVKYGAEQTFMATDFATTADTVRQATKDGLRVKSAGDAAKRYNPVSVALKGGRKVGNFTEIQARSVNFLAHLDNGATAESAAEFVKKFHFDYTDLTEAEKAIFKRAFPFYTWMRKNIPLQLEELFNQPAKFSMYNRLSDASAEMIGAELANAPDWLKEQFPIVFSRDDEQGKDKMLAMSPPSTDLNLNVRDIMNAINPLAKVPLELFTNQSFLNGAPIDKTGQDTTELLGMDLPAKYAHALKQFGVLRTVDKVTSPQADSTYSTGAVVPIGTFNEGKARVNAKYEYARDLGNVIQALEQQGVYVPTISEQALLKYLPPEARKNINGLSPTMKAMLKKLRAADLQNKSKGW